MSKNFELLEGAPLEPSAIETVRFNETLSRVPQVRAVESETVSDWEKTLEVYSRHWRLSALFAAAVLLTVLIGSYLTKPSYEPAASLEITPPGAEAFSMQGYVSPSSDSEYLATQAKILQSDELALAVIRQLQLEHNKEFTDRSLLTRWSSPLLSGIKKLGRVIGPKEAEPQASQIGTPQITTEESRVLTEFRTRLTVRRDTSSRLVTVSFLAHDARLAADVTNALLNAFVEKTFRDKHDAVTKSTQWLAKQLDDVQKNMNESNRALADFQRQTGIADIDTGKSTVSERMSAQSQQLTQAQSERIQYQSFIDGIHASGANSLPQTGLDPVVQQLSQRLAESKAELSQAEAVYGKNHPNVRKLQNQASMLQSELDNQRKAIVDQLHTNYTAAYAREKMMSDQMRDTSARLTDLARYNSLKKEAEANSDLYKTLYARIKEAGIAAEAKSSNVRIVTPAWILESPTKPNWLLNIAAGLLVALVGALMLPFLRERLDNTVRSAADVKTWTGLGAVAVVPLIQGDGSKSNKLRLARERDWGFRLLGGEAKPQPAEAFLIDRPHAPESEAVRTVLTSLLMTWRDGMQSHVLQVASSLPGEGKTTIAVNLAIALSHYGATCLVDADLRKPGVSRAFRVRSEPGLEKVLAGRANLKDAVIATSIANLSVLTSASTPEDPAELILSGTMRDALDALRTQFRFVILDSPPLLPFAEGRFLASLADSLILIGRAGQTPRVAMKSSMELLMGSNSAPVLQVVLNASDEHSGRAYGYSYSAD